MTCSTPGCMRATPAKPSSTTQSILAPGTARAASVTAGHWCTTSPREGVWTIRNRLLVDKRLVGRAQALRQRDARLPAESAHERDVQQLLRRTVGLGAVVDDLGPASDGLAHRRGELGDRLVLAAADVHERRTPGAQARAHLGAMFDEMNAGVGHVVAVQELASRRAGPPDGDRTVVTEPRLVELAHQRGQNVARLQVVIVPGPVKIRRHGAEVARAVLAVVGPAHLDAGDLGDRVGTVRGLERPGEKKLFLDRLRAGARVDARGAEKQELAHAGAKRLVDDVGLDGEVVVDELSGRGRAGEAP